MVVREVRETKEGSTSMSGVVKGAGTGTLPHMLLYYLNESELIKGPFNM